MNYMNLLIIISLAAAFDVDEEPRMEMNQHMFEGDILLPPELDKMENSVTENERWSGGVVPFIINKRQFSNKQVSLIKRAMAEIMKKTCIKFVKAKRNQKQNSLKIVREKEGCFAVGLGSNYYSKLNLGWCAEEKHKGIKV